MLVHHPYDAFDTSVETFVEQASRDPHVLAIKQTLYRTSGRDSAIVRSLVRAAEAGKQVAALVELTARFDEQSNIAWARVLEQAGVHVVYGVVGLKTHAKVSLVVRDEGDRIHRYCHVGTGNYHPVTARLYEDLGLLTADEEVTADVADLFNYLTGYSAQESYSRILVAPLTLRDGLLEQIERESKPGGLDHDEDERARRPPDDRRPLRGLVRRGRRPAVRPGDLLPAPGDRRALRADQVRSAVGRYLEHSRIFRFGNGEGTRHFMGSADLMPRNLDKRVECVVEVVDPALRERLDRILALAEADDVLAWDLRPEGWLKAVTTEGVDAQLELRRLAEERAGG